jgi:hypothetical protein
MYRSAFVVIFDDGGHFEFVEIPDVLDLFVSFGSITIEGSEPFVTVAGEVDEAGTFTAAGTGTVAGFPEIAVTFEGTVSAAGLQGEYAMGTEGGLPGGLPIIFEVRGEPVETADDGETDVADGGAAGVSDEIRAFYEAFNAAQADGDAAAMAALLHPATPDRYGAEACDAYLASIVNPAVTVEPLEVLGRATWEYMTDGVTAQIEDAFTIRVAVTVGNDPPIERDAHLAVRPDGTLGWFTDCGEVLG